MRMRNLFSLFILVSDEFIDTMLGLLRVFGDVVFPVLLLVVQ